MAVRDVRRNVLCMRRRSDSVFHTNSCLIPTTNGLKRGFKVPTNVLSFRILLKFGSLPQKLELENFFLGGAGSTSLCIGIA